MPLLLSSQSSWRVCCGSVLLCIFASHVGDFALTLTGVVSSRTRLGASALSHTAARTLGTTMIAQDEPDLALDSDDASQKMAQVEQLLAHRNLPKWHGRAALEQPALLWWFLRDRRFDVSEAASKIERCLLWRKEFRAERLGPELFGREMRSRKAYLHRHTDLAGRPVMVAFAHRHNVLERRLDESCHMCVWHLEQALDRLSLSEPPTLADTSGLHHDSSVQLPIEQVMGIFDVRDFSPLSMDPEFAKFLVDILYNYYPKRVGRVLFVGAPDLFRSFWDSLRPLIGRHAEVAEFVTAEEVREDYFAPGCAPLEFQKD